MSSRPATHANSWYSSDSDKLRSQLERWLADAHSHSAPDVKAGVRAVIVPHAGYDYSGPTAAYAYNAIDPTDIERVFILGPSHHFYLRTCAVSGCTTYETPVGNLTLDSDVLAQLGFGKMTLKQDMDEHSIEMHLPYLAHIFAKKPVKFVPVLVGAIDAESEKRYGKVLAPYLEDRRNLFVVSSDFCHWGRRFDYTFYYTSPAHSASTRLSSSTAPSREYPIHASISDLDHEGMDAIQESHEAFVEYLERTGNTICGRHPIGVLLAAIEVLGVKAEIKWLKYEQSSHCARVSDSSVSYASGAVIF